MEITGDQSPANMSHEARMKHRAERKKKPGSLPLRMFLSMDDEFANPNCVHASNPFHKCGDSCYRRAASLPGKPDDKGVQFKCIHAANPFHTCIDSCRQHDRGSGSGRRKLADKGRPDKVNETRSGVNPSCIHASNAFHVCSESCFQKIAAKDGVRGAVGNVKQGDDNQSKCSYASNPFHKCNESCNQKNAVKGVVGIVKQGDANQSNCSYASNPFHKCTESCNQKNAVRGVVGIAKQGNDNQSKCSYSSNPFHTCNEYCVNRKTGGDPVKTGGTQVLKEEKKEVAEMIETKNVHLKQEDTTHAKTKSVEDLIKTAYEPDFLFFLRGVPSSRREQEKNDKRLGVTEKDDVQQRSVSPPILSEKEIAENEQVEIVPKEEKKEVVEMIETKNVHHKQEDTTNAKTKSVVDSIKTAYEPDFLFFLRGVPSSRREQEKNDKRLGVTEKDDVQQRSVSPPILTDKEIAENEQVEIRKPVLNPSSPIVFTNFIFVVVYVAHLIVMSAVYSKKSKV